MATTVQLARGLGFSGGEGLRLRACLRGSAERLGGRFTTKIMVRDLDVEHLQGPDGRRLEVVSDYFSLFGATQTAVDTTSVSALRSDGNARRHAVDSDGVALEAARKGKERTYPELAGGPPQGPSGGGCRRSWRPMVGRHQEFPVAVGQSESPR